MNLTDIAALIIGALTALWERWTNLSTMEWLGLCATIAVFSLASIAIHTMRIRELMEGPTERCRYCRRLYPLAEVTGLDRTCYRRACRKQYHRYRDKSVEVRKVVLERWNKVQVEVDGALSNENLKQRNDELTEELQYIERMYGGERPIRKREERLAKHVLKTLDAGFQRLASHIDRLSVPKYAEGPPIIDVQDLHEGDLVVHEQYGLARFVGVRKLRTEGEESEYVTLQYAHGNTLHVPVAQLMDVLSEYEGDPSAAVLDRLHLLD